MENAASTRLVNFRGRGLDIVGGLIKIFGRQRSRGPLARGLDDLLGDTILQIGAWRFAACAFWQMMNLA